MGCLKDGGYIEFVAGAEKNEYEKLSPRPADEARDEYRDEDRFNATEMGVSNNSHRHIFVSGTDDPFSETLSGGTYDHFSTENIGFVEAAGASKARGAVELKAIAEKYKDNVAKKFQPYAGKTYSASLGAGGETWEAAITSARLHFRTV